MASITLTIPDSQATRILNGFAKSRNWDKNSGETKTQFLKRKLVEYVMESISSQEGNDAADIARQTAVDSVLNDIAIT